MATFTVNLSPALVNLGTEGSLDTSLDANGNSAQRKLHSTIVPNGTDLKVVGNLADGASFNDTIEVISDIDGIDA